MNGGQVIVRGDYRKQELLPNGTWQYGWGRLNMDDPNDYLLVEGDFYWDYVGDDEGMMKDGVIELRGDFYQLSSHAGEASNHNFQPEQNHRVVFSGQKLQNIFFSDAKGSTEGNCFFNVMENRNYSRGGVDCIESINAKRLFGSGYFQTLNIRNDAMGDTKVLLLESDIVVLLDLILKSNVNLNGKKLEVGGDFRHERKTFDMNGGQVIVRGHYRKQELLPDGTWQYGWGSLKMDHPNDYLLVEGDFYWDYVGDDEGMMKDGVIELRGDFYQLSTHAGEASNHNFQPEQNHRVVFSGHSMQSIYFVDPWGNSSGNTFFNMVENRNSQGLSFNSKVRIVRLFQHRRNPFTLHTSATDTDFNDYDSDGLRDHLDPFPEIAGFQTDANGNGIPDDVTQGNYTYDAWKALHFSQGSPNYSWDSAYLNDYEKGGLPNIFEYLHGFNPHVIELSPVIHYIARNVVDDEDYWAMKFPVVRATLGTVEYYGEGSDDMLTWTRLTRSPKVMSSVDEIDTIRVMDDVSITTNQQRFLRLVVKPIIEP